MIDPATDLELRRLVAADRAATLHRAARPASPGSLRRGAGSGLVRLGLLLAGDTAAAAASPARRPALRDEVPACAGASSL